MTIGILAGMGPRSTAPFVDSVVDACQKHFGARHDIDFPRMMILSQPTPFYLDRSIDHQAMQAAILSGLQKLEASGVDFIAMPCNSAHRYFEELQSSIGIPLLNIMDTAVAGIKEDTGVTIFATSSTLESGLYRKKIKEKGARFVFDARWQPLINEVIGHIKAGEKQQALSRWNKLLKSVQQDERVDTIILACTDLNVVADLHPPQIPCIDASRALAYATAERYYT